MTISTISGNQPTAIRKFFRHIGQWYIESRTISALSSLTDAQLREIGIKRGDIRSSVLDRST